MSQVEIVAEIANAHQGELAQAIDIASQAIEQGVDAIKFQIYFADELLVRKHPRYEHFKKQAFSEEEYTSLIRQFSGREVRVYCDVFGKRALDIALEAGTDGFKIHSTDIANEPLVARIGESGKTALFSTGGTTAPELTRALECLLRKQPTTAPRPFLLHGYQTFPTPIKDASLKRLNWLQEQFGQWVEIGYMDHVEGASPFATIMPAMAIAMGARMIEKHITLSREDEGVDWYSSINVADLGRFVEDMRLAEQSVGNEKFFSSSELSYRSKFKKYWVTRSQFKKGHVLQKSDLEMKQAPEPPFVPVALPKLVGRKLTQNVSDEHVMQRSDVATTVWACVVARSKSSRLPGKALIDIAGQPALSHLLERLKHAKRIDHIVLCTTTESEDDAIADLASHKGVGLYRGPVKDVLGRMLGAVEKKNVDIVLRVTGDDILVDPHYVDQSITQHLAHNVLYSDAKALPSGTEVEVFDVDLLKILHAAGSDTDGTEYLTTYITDNADHFPGYSLEVPSSHARDWRLTLDTPEDLSVIQPFLEEMTRQGKTSTYNLDDIIAFFTRHPNILSRNAGMKQRATPIEVDTSMQWSRICDGLGEGSRHER